MTALAANWRIQVKNATGQTSGAVSIKGKRWKPGSSGEIDHEDTEQTFLSVASIASGAFAAPSNPGISNDGTGEGYHGVQLSISITNGSSAGNYEIYLQHSSDGGTTWPDDGEGELIGVIAVDVSATKKTNLSI
jgi:hypothetical protein